MDKCTHEVRKQHWKNTINQCLRRPQGMTVKQWLDENNICEQTYYHWLKRIRQETYELATTSANTACVKTVCSEVAFAEVPLPVMNPAMPSENGFCPDITIQTGSVPIGVNILLNTLYFVSVAALGYQLTYYNLFYLYRNSKTSPFIAKFGRTDRSARMS